MPTEMSALFQLSMSVSKYLREITKRLRAACLAALSRQWKWSIWPAKYTLRRAHLILIMGAQDESHAMK